MSYAYEHYNIANTNLADTTSLKCTTSRRVAIIVVEKDSFLRECLALTARVFSEADPSAFASLAGLVERAFDPDATVLLLSIISLDEGETARELSMLLNMTPQLKTLVLAQSEDPDRALAAFSHGGNGFVSTSAGLKNVIDALRFISVAETTVPAPCLLAAESATLSACEYISNDAITAAEYAVIQAIRAGESNSLIARQLNLPESAVETHVRNLLQKLRAKDRAEIAIKDMQLPPPCVINPDVLCDRDKERKTPAASSSASTMRFAARSPSKGGN